MSLNSSPYSSAWRVVLGEAVLSAPEDTIPLVNLFLCCLDTDTAQLGPGQGPPGPSPHQELRDYFRGPEEQREDSADTAPKLGEDPS